MKYLNISKIPELQNDYILDEGINYRGQVFCSTEHGLKFFKYNQNPKINQEILHLCLQKQTHGKDLRNYEFHNKNSLKINPNYQSQKYNLLLDLNTLKFSKYNHLAKILIQTKPLDLVEITTDIDPYGLPWADTFWGMYSSTGEEKDLQGQNKMGEILTTIRTKLLQPKEKYVY